METERTGKVWLVGAGPSDPGLFTLKGRQVLRQAEVVVYDALVGEGVRNMIPDEAEAINVGKRSSNHTMPQEKINELLAARAKEGKRVVRLKGGDPFLFGRGGEEIEELIRENIPFEVVPGITSAIAVPAYQGIPVTHRDFCSSVHIITGHKRAGEPYNIDFEALVRTRGTLVFLMGVAALGDICRGLLDGGMAADMPAALLMQGTTAGQQRIVATVSTLEEEVARRGAKTPAIIVVGTVCSLAEEFSWYEKMPLGGVKVLLTRPRERSSETAARMRSLGADVLEMPAIRTVKKENNQPLHRALDRIEQYQWLVFTSPAGVRIFFEEMADAHRDVRSLGSIRIAAIGSGTQKELGLHGLFADLVPEVFDGAHLGEALAQACRGGEQILIPRAQAGGQELIEALHRVETSGRAGVKIDDISIYDTVYEAGHLVDEKAALESGAVDYVVFTSASTVRGFAAALPGLDYTKIRAICIGRQTEMAAGALGMQTHVSRSATIDSLVACLVETHKKEQQ